MQNNTGQQPPMTDPALRIPSENEWIDPVWSLLSKLFEGSSYFDPLRAALAKHDAEQQTTGWMDASGGDRPQQQRPPDEKKTGARIPSENEWIDPAWSLLSKLFEGSSYFDPLPVKPPQPPVQYTGQPPFTPSGQALFGLSDTGTGSMPQQPPVQGPFVMPYPGQPMSPEQANFMMSAFAGPGVARQPSQSAAVNTPGRPAIEGPAPSQSNSPSGRGSTILSLEPQPLSPLSMEPNPLEVRPKLREGPFELAELLSLAKEQPVSPEMAQAESGGGMGTAAKIAMALGGLGLALGLRNQYRKDKGRLARHGKNGEHGGNMAAMLGMMGQGLGGYANYKQGEASDQRNRQMFDDKIRTQMLLAMAKQQADAQELEANLGQKRTEETGRDKRAELSARIQAEIAKANLELRERSISGTEAYRNKLINIREGERDEVGQGMEMLVLKNLELKALADLDAGILTENSQLHPALRSISVTIDGLKRKLAAIARGESFKAMEVPMRAAMGSAVMRSGIIDPLQTGPWQPILEPLMRRTEEEGSSDYTED